MSRRPASALPGFGAAGAAVVVALALAAGLALRLARLDVRPMHNDEANQAIKFGELLERGEYVYDAFDHHGPTLYYLTLPVAWLRGQATLAATDEWTLRSLPVAFGAATILLLPLLPAGIGRATGASAAVLMAVSPAMVFYSRMYIQESMFACFALAFAIALGRAMTEGGTPLAGAGRRRRGPGHRDQGNVGHRAARVAGRLRPGVVVAGAGATRRRAGQRASAHGGAHRPRRLRGRRGALLFVVPDPSRGHPGAPSRRPDLRRRAASIPPTTCTRGTSTSASSPGRRREG